MLKIKNLNIEIGDNSLLKNLSFNVEKGKICSILGANGSGKTTLFNTLFYKGVSKEFFTLNDRKINKNEISYIESNQFFYPFLRVEEFLEIINYKKLEILKPLVSSFDLPLKNYINELSTGEKKKLSIISGILTNRKIYFFDEPFNGLDFESYELLVKLFNSKLFADKYVIVTSHILSSITSISNKIILLKNGKIDREYNKSEFNTIYNIYEEELNRKTTEIERFS